ncbi:hypothetical protein GCM10007036_42420 [Alsobacter metallidurans]|uniref:Phytase-like domain-containing protein n=1 Tax=Alsobacter metallidurans TaxID=340221 RepID=A0A917IB52_9HYPH|nr:esterase-like activity of phytase family protein [Alsobacter metallidurans]GGH31299.1 hypothetical protein GCM10007036_42420 [Alsobacter metallidurans]
MRLSRRAFGRGLVAAAAGFAAGRVAAAQGPEVGLAVPTAIRVKARPVERLPILGGDVRRFGALEFIGGLDLDSDDRNFGGWSGLSISADGQRILAVSDVGGWLSARVAYTERTPTAIVEASIAPLLGADGTPLWRTRAWDSESLCVHDGVAYVGFERVHEVRRFDIGREGLLARGQIIPVPPAVKTLPENRSLEAIGIATAGALAGSLVVIAERATRGADAPTKGWILTGPQRGEFRVVRRDDFDITDLAFLPDGDMLMLERRFNWLDGVGMRIRRVPGGSIRPGALLDGPVLVDLDMRQHIDNMEGLAIHRGPDGAVILSLISDDNFSFIQRTTFLQFRLVE